jgi:hypothetical protein
MSLKWAALWLGAAALVTIVWWHAMDPPVFDRTVVSDPPRDVFINTDEDTSAHVEYVTYVIRTKDAVYHVRGTHICQGCPPQEAMFVVKNAATNTTVLALPPSSVIEYHRVTR